MTHRSRSHQRAAVRALKRVRPTGRELLLFTYPEGEECDAPVLHEMLADTAALELFKWKLGEEQLPMGWYECPNGHVHRTLGCGCLFGAGPA